MKLLTDLNAIIDLLCFISLVFVSAFIGALLSDFGKNRKVIAIAVCILLLGIIGVRQISDTTKMKNKIDKIASQTEAAKPNKSGATQIAKPIKTPMHEVVTKPIDSSIDKVSVVSSVLNGTRKERYWTPAIKANRNDDIFYRVAIINDSEDTVKNAKFRTVLPPCIDYVKGFAKVYYEDEKGIDQVGAASDSINGMGVLLMDIPGRHWIYVTFKAKVNEGAALRSFCAPANQLIADGNISLSSNNATIYVQ